MELICNPSHGDDLVVFKMEPSPDESARVETDCRPSSSSSPTLQSVQEDRDQCSESGSSLIGDKFRKKPNRRKKSADDPPPGPPRTGTKKRRPYTRRRGRRKVDSLTEPHHQDVLNAKSSSPNSSEILEIEDLHHHYESGPSVQLNKAVIGGVGSPVQYTTPPTLTSYSCMTPPIRPDQHHFLPAAPPPPQLMGINRISSPSTHSIQSQSTNTTNRSTAAYSVCLTDDTLTLDMDLQDSSVFSSEDRTTNPDNVDNDLIEDFAEDGSEAGSDDQDDSEPSVIVYPGTRTITKKKRKKNSKKVPKRTTTNTRERARQQNVNGAFADLRAIIPTHPVDKKLSKHDILRIAIKYIKLLQSVQKIQDAEEAEHVDCRPAEGICWVTLRKQREAELKRIAEFRASMMAAAALKSSSTGTARSSSSAGPQQRKYRKKAINQSAHHWTNPSSLHTEGGLRFVKPPFLIL